MEATWFCMTFAIFLFIQLFGSTMEMEKVDYMSHHVTCSKGLSSCTVKAALIQQCAVTDTVLELRPNVTLKPVLCCTRGTNCRPCLQVHFDIQHRKLQNASFVICYQVPNLMPQCKMLKFTMTPVALHGETTSSLHMSVLLKDNTLDFNSLVNVDVCCRNYEVVFPSQDEECSQSTILQRDLKACRVPSFSIVINQERREVMLQVEEKETSDSLQMCLKHEENGICKKWGERTIQLHRVTPCMCFQLWWANDERTHRVERCPFRNQTDRFQGNVWDNVSVSVLKGQMNSGAAMLSWNLTAPCRVEAEVVPCQMEAGVDKDRCIKLDSLKQTLPNVTWKENDSGHWLFPGVFENVNTDLCVMVIGKNSKLGPFCPSESSRWHWRWSLLVLLSIMLLGLAAICICFLHGKLKRWAWQWHQRKHGQLVMRGHVVLLSPPDVDGSVAELVCKLGSNLRDQGLTVSVDLWSRAEICSLGPLPWLHSQLQLLDCRGGRAILVLTQAAREKAKDWGRLWDQPGGDMKLQVEGEGDGLLQCLSSPYADVFGSALTCIKADLHKGSVGDRFMLVQFKTQSALVPSSDTGLPELFQGLPMFYLPSQSQGLFSALAKGSWPRLQGFRT
ncbi:hypothetical protein UPYG_G00160820 [Umbra pygmaea]|uniref:SEFIR domain-containing protein n=1 Tax=Umbra pygmaea TaxID=75934 RepID=A0ABD0X9G1_UMBPY